MFSSFGGVSLLDYCDYNSSGVVLRCGGYYNQVRVCGLFYVSGDGAASYLYAGIGCRLLKLP